MNRTVLITSMIVASLTGGAFLSFMSPTLTVPSIATSTAEHTKSKGPELTVYNQNFALVKDFRTIKMTQGTNNIFIDDVAALIDPTSVHFKALKNPNNLTVQEQNFRYDLINKTNILDRMVGQTIRFRKNNEIKEGILLNPATTYTRYQNNGYGNKSYSKTTNSNFAVQTEDGILLTSLGDILIDKIPEGLYPKPTLMWDVYSQKQGIRNTEISYLTDGINWNTDYVAVVNDDDNRIDLKGWVTLNNQSGTSYTDAQLKLVAGDVRKLKSNGRLESNEMAYAGRAAAMKSQAKKDFKEENFFEYHLYTLSAPTTVANNETKQISMVSSQSIPIQKKFIYDPDRVQYINWYYHGYSDGYYGTFNYYYNRPGQGRDTSKYQKINTLLILENTKKNHLGIPLPKGRIRVNKADSSGAIQFVGEDWIDHTPEDEKVELYLGDAFDLIGEKKRIDYKRDNDFVTETYEVTLKNHKKRTETIHVVDHLFGDWTITEKSANYTKVDAHTIDFPIKVPAKGKRTLTYTIRIKRS